MKKTKPRENLINAETQGYEHDRRALLLAHSRSLRKSASEKKVPLPIVQSNSRPKIKKVNSLVFFLVLKFDVRLSTYIIG